MQSENTNNTDWKSRLEDASLFAGEALQNKDAAWQKLQQRLHAKPRRKRTVAYWVAAACVLLALLIPFVHLPENQNIALKNTAKNNSLKVKLKTTAPANKNITATSAAPVFTSKKNTVVTNFEKKNIDSKRDSIEHITAPVEDLVITKKDAALPVIKPDSADNATVVIVPQKKKLKVVHINELGDPIEEPTDIASSAEQHLLPWNLGNGEVFSNPSVAYSKHAIPLLKTKPSTSN